MSSFDPAPDRTVRPFLHAHQKRNVDYSNLSDRIKSDQIRSDRILSAARATSVGRTSVVSNNAPTEPTRNISSRFEESGKNDNTWLPKQPVTFVRTGCCRSSCRPPRQSVGLWRPRRRLDIYSLRRQRHVVDTIRGTRDQRPETTELTYWRLRWKIEVGLIFLILLSEANHQTDPTSKHTVVYVST